MLSPSDEYAQILFRFFRFGNFDPYRSIKNLREEWEFQSPDDHTAYYIFCDSLVRNPDMMKSHISALLKNPDVIPSERQRAAIVFVNFFAKPLALVRLVLNIREFLSNYPRLYPRDTIPLEFARYTDILDELLQLLELFFINARNAGETHVLNAWYTEINKKLVKPNRSQEVYTKFSRKQMTRDDLIIFYTSTPKHIFLLSISEYIECS